MTKDSDQKHAGRIAEGDTTAFPTLPPGLSSIGELVAIIKDVVDGRIAEREIFAFVELNQPVPKGTIQDCFPQWDTASILAQLESAGLVSCTLRPTIQGEHPFYSIKELPH